MANTEKCRLDICNQMDDILPMGKTSAITIRITPGEKRLIKAAARYHQQTMAFYVRDTVLGDVRTIEGGVRGKQKLTREINRLIHLLQMARTDG